MFAWEAETCFEITPHTEFNIVDADFEKKRCLEKLDKAGVVLIPCQFNGGCVL